MSADSVAIDLPAPADWLGLHVGDARHILDLLPAEPCLDLTITSPPYGATVDYGAPGQVGFGQSHPDYLADMANILGALHERTRESGSLWLIADTIKVPTDSGVGRLVPLPFQLAAEAERVGWILEDVIVWRKDRTLPWSRRGQLRNAFEYVLFLVKGPEFKYHLERIRSNEGIEDWWRRYPERYSPLGAAPTNVWEFPIPLQGSWSGGLLQHQCPLPPALVERIVALTSDPGDVVCDPFAGIGTVPAVAAAQGRHAFGVELLPSNVEQFYSAVLPEALASVASHGRDAPRIHDGFALDVARLRHAKLLRVLTRALRSQQLPVMGAIARAHVELADRPSAQGVGSQALTLYAIDHLDEVETAARRALARPPLSKFGIAVKLEIRPSSAWARPQRGEWSRIALDRLLPVSLDPLVVATVDTPVVLIDLPLAQLLAPLTPVTRRKVGPSRTGDGSRHRGRSVARTRSS